MTPECPKGPEREARPEESLRERVAEHFRVTWNYEDMNKSCWKAADRAIDALRPELEQITFERDAAQQAADVLCDQLKDLRDDVLGDESLSVPEIVSAAGRTVERLTAEVERLREQVERTRRAERRSIASVLTGLLEELEAAYVHEVGAGPAQTLDKLRSVQAFSVDLFATSSPVELDEFKPASPIVHTVLLSSDTGVMGEWQAFCSGCRQRSVGDLAHAEFWKDQHLADVLVPQLQANSKLGQNLELTPQQAADELSRETREIYGADPERVPTLEELRSRHRRYTRVEGRPSGSKAAAPQAVDRRTGLLEQIAYRLWHLEIAPAGWTDEQVASTWTALMDVDSTADEGKWGGWWAAAEAALAVVEPEFERRGADVLRDMAAELLEQCDDWDDEFGACAESVPDPACRIRAIVNRYVMPQDAALAAGSEATPEDSDVEHDDLADFPLENLRDWKSVQANVITRSPSPSLRKEGEDSD